MKYIKWKTLIITCFICLLPILLGLSLWERLPDQMAIHFNINNEADNFASKEFTVFAIPFFMAIAQIFSSASNDIAAQKNSIPPNMKRITTWIIPVMSVVLQTVTIGYSLGWNIDIRRIVVLIVAAIFLVLGSYLPKLDYIKNFKTDRETAKKINRLMGIETIIMGILLLITLFLPPVSTIIWIFLLIPYTIITIVHAIKASKKN